MESRQYYNDEIQYSNYERYLESSSSWHGSPLSQDSGYSSIQQHPSPMSLGYQPEQFSYEGSQDSKCDRTDLAPSFDGPQAALRVPLYQTADYNQQQNHQSIRCPGYYSVHPGSPHPSSFEMQQPMQNESEGFAPSNRLELAGIGRQGSVYYRVPAAGIQQQHQFMLTRDTSAEEQDTNPYFQTHKHLQQQQSPRPIPIALPPASRLGSVELERRSNTNSTPKRYRKRSLQQRSQQCLSAAQKCEIARLQAPSKMHRPTGFWHDIEPETPELQEQEHSSLIPARSLLQDNAEHNYTAQPIHCESSPPPSPNQRAQYQHLKDSIQLRKAFFAKSDTTSSRQVSPQTSLPYPLEKDKEPEETTPISPLELSSVASQTIAMPEPRKPQPISLHLETFSIYEEDNEAYVSALGEDISPLILNHAWSESLLRARSEDTSTKEAPTSERSFDRRVSYKLRREPIIVEWETGSDSEDLNDETRADRADDRSYKYLSRHVQKSEILDDGLLNAIGNPKANADISESDPRVEQVFEEHSTGQYSDPTYTQATEETHSPAATSGLEVNEREAHSGASDGGDRNTASIETSSTPASAECSITSNSPDTECDGTSTQAVESVEPSSPTAMPSKD